MNKSILIALAAIVTLGSCAIHRGNFSMSAIEKNVTYKEQAIGVSQCTHILGIGGLSQDALVYAAKKDLYRNYPLSVNETYANFTLDFKRSFYLLFSKTKITMTADIIEFDTANDSTVFTSTFKKTINSGGVKKSSLFEVGDTIIYNTDQTATILSFPKTGYAKIKTETEPGKFYSKNISIDNIYTNQKEYRGIRAGGTYPYEEQGKDEVKTYVGVVIAVGEKTMLLQKSNKKIIVQEYKE